MFSIDGTDELADFFVHSKLPEVGAVYVSGLVRAQWLLNHRTVTIKGHVRDIQFANKSGGVWEARLVPKGNQS